MVVLWPRDKVARFKFDNVVRYNEAPLAEKLLSFVISLGVSDV